MNLFEAREKYLKIEQEKKLEELTNPHCSNCKFSETIPRTWLRYKRVKCLVKDETYDIEGNHGFAEIWDNLRALECNI